MGASGASYSLNGYINLISIRSTKTILVEGVSDRKVLMRLLHDESSPVGSKSPLVDVVDLIKDPTLSGLGNRVKVQSISDIVRKKGNINRKISALIDREWDDVYVDDKINMEMWAPPVQSSGRFITVGHSIENYHFDSECINSYVKFAFPDFYNANFSLAVTGRFPQILILAASYSYYAYINKIIGRCDGVVGYSDFLFSENEVFFGNTLEAKLTSRGIPDAANFIACVNQCVKSPKWKRTVANKYTHWLVHGHLGCNVIWAAVAAISSNFHASMDVINTISRVNCSHRDNFWREWLCGYDDCHVFPLRDLVRWSIRL